MRLALFVEGSESPPSSILSLSAVWADIIKDLGLTGPDVVYPIDKRHLTAMDPSRPAMSGRSEGLDELLARKHKLNPFEAAIVLWDRLSRRSASVLHRTSAGKYAATGGPTSLAGPTI